MHRATHARRQDPLQLLKIFWPIKLPTFSNVLLSRYGIRCYGLLWHSQLSDTFFHRTIATARVQRFHVAQRGPRGTRHAGGAAVFHHARKRLHGRVRGCSWIGEGEGDGDADQDRPCAAHLFFEFWAPRRRSWQLSTASEAASSLPSASFRDNGMRIDGIDGSVPRVAPQSPATVPYSARCLTSTKNH